MNVIVKFFLGLLTKFRIWRRYRKWDIRKDATLDVHTNGSRLRDALGTRPEFQPDTNPEHADLASAYDCDETLAAQEQKANLSRDRLRDFTPRWALLLGLAVFFIVEFLSCVSFFKSMGVALPERAVFGVGLAAGVFYLTHRVVVLSRPEGIGVVRRRPLFTVVVSILAALVLAIVVVRVSSTSHRAGESFLFSLSSAVIFAALAVLMSFLADRLLGMYHEVAPFAKQAMHDRLEVLRTRLQKRRAAREIAAIQERGETWDYWADRASGKYQRLWTQARAAAGMSPEIPVDARGPSDMPPFPSTAPTT